MGGLQTLNWFTPAYFQIYYLFCKKGYTFRLYYFQYIILTPRSANIAHQFKL